MKTNSNVILIIVVAVLLISNLFFGYMLFFRKGNSPDQRGFQNAQLTDEQKQNVNSFFESTTDTTAINNYCKQNMIGCFYYCKEVNSANSFCSQIEKGPSSQTSQRLN
jgi:hypothetical protein